MPEIIKGYCQLCIMQNEPKDVVKYSVSCLDGDTETVTLCEDHLRSMIKPFLKRQEEEMQKAISLKHPKQKTLQ